MSPLLAIGGFLCYRAIEGIGQQNPIWLFSFLPLVLGIAFVGLWFFVLWRECIWLPGVTITRFELVDRNLRLQIPHSGEIDVQLDDILKLRRQPSKLGTAGWWILLKQHRWIYLYNDRGKASVLAEHLENRETTRAKKFGTGKLRTGR
jgi:hypothetical protein